MSSAGGRPSRQKMVSVGTSIVPPGPRPSPADTPGPSTAATTPQVTASLHDFAVSLALCLFFGDAYEEVMRLLVAGLHFTGAWQKDWQVPTTGAIAQARQRLGAQISGRGSRPAY